MRTNDSGKASAKSGTDPALLQGIMRCEDFPCCGHEPGCCPDYNPETGEQLNMKCVCGASVPLTSHVSLCDACLRSDNYDDVVDDAWNDYPDEEEEEG